MSLVRQIKYRWFPRLVIFLLNIFFTSRAQPYRYRAGDRVTIIRPDGIGDFIMFTSFLRELRHNWPEATINLFVSPDAYTVASACPYVNQVIALPKAYYRVNKNNILYPWICYHLAKKYLRPLKSDVILLPRYDFDSFATYLAVFSGCKHRIGYTEQTTPEKKLYNYGYDRMLTEVLPAQAIAHEVCHNLFLLKYLQCEIHSDQLELWLPPEVRSQSAQLLAGYSRPILGMVLSAGMAKRIWPSACFAQVALDFLHSTPGTVVILGPPGDTALVADFLSVVADLTPRCVNLVGQTNVLESAGCLAHCQFYVGNDTGPAHVAAAAGAAVVVVSCHPLSGNTESSNSPTRFRPWSDKCTVIQPQKPASGCINECLKHYAPHCILSVSTSEVIAALRCYTGAHETAASDI